jgi:protoporphyrinogen oxidase
MFEFVYKMFGEGLASLPKGGIEKIPQQLADQLNSSEFHFNKKVEKVQDNEVHLKDGNTLTFDFIIIATEPSQLIPNMKNQETTWKSCQTLYFTTSHRFISKPLIGLIADEDSLANNIFYHNSLATEQKGDQELLSVTVVKDHTLSDKELITRVQNDLEKYCGIDGLNFLKLYRIPKALPDLQNLQYELAPSETQLTHYIFLAGDTQLNGSLNAAMLSGEKAATGVLEKMGVITYSG